MRLETRRLRVIAGCAVVVALALAAAVPSLSATAHAGPTGTASLGGGPTSSASPASPTTEPNVESNVATIPAEAPLNTSKYLGKPIRSVITDKREVAITFDDGPSSNTMSIAAILAKNDAYASFFFCGRTLRGPGPNYVREVARAGNDIGNHTVHHVMLGKSISTSKMRWEIERNQALLKGIVGFSPRFLRPRSGVYGSRALRIAKADGLILVLWSAYGGDAGARPPVATIVKNATHNVKPGSIILLHETNPDTVKALPKILAELKRKGLKPVTLSTLLAHSKGVR